MGEVKQTNFRIDTETADAFRSFCEEQGFNQAQGFDHLMQVLALNQAKVGIEGRLTEITTFEEYIKKILDAYIFSLQIAQDTEERVREDYKTDIALRDRAIADSERKILDRDETIARIKVELDEARNTAIESVKAAENATKQAASTTQIAEEKGKINDMLSAKLADAEDKLAGYNKLKESEETLKKQINDLQHNNNMLQVELNHAKEKNSEIKCKLNEANESINEFKDIITDLKSQIIRLNRDIEEQKRTSSQAQEIAVERAIAQTEKSMMEQISSLRDEKVRLETKIEMMK